MAEFETITDVRLTAIESLLQKLYGLFLANLDRDSSVNLKEQLLNNAGKWEIYRNTPPQDVETIERRMKFVEFQIRCFLEIAEKQEEAVRKSMGLPLANLPTGSFDKPK